MIAIIGILAAVPVPNLMNARRLDQDRAAQVLVNSAVKAAEIKRVSENVGVSATQTVTFLVGNIKLLGSGSNDGAFNFVPADWTAGRARSAAPTS